MTHFALIPTSVLMIVVSATTTGSTMVTMLCGPSETEILATTYSTALAPAHLLLSETPSLPWCPVRSLLNYLHTRPPSPGPLFVTQRRTPYTREGVAKTLKASLVAIGVAPERYNTHSLRVGRATDLALEGASDATIRATGRWRSNAFLSYLRLTE